MAKKKKGQALAWPFFFFADHGAQAFLAFT